MSPINFENLTAERPEFAQVWRVLREWLESHPKVRAVPIDRLARVDRTVPAAQLAKALNFLIDCGLAREVYRVKDLDGTLLEGEYQSLAEVPRKVPDRFRESYIDTSETDVVPVFKFDRDNVNATG